MYQQLIWNLNNSIVSILRLLSKDLIISKTLLLQLTSSLVDQLKEMEFNYSSDLSKSYKNWPLSSPLYLYEYVFNCFRLTFWFLILLRRENLLTESYSEEELESVATNVLNDIYSLRNAGYDKRLIFKKFTEIKKIYSENVVYKKFLDIFSPNLKDLFVLSSLEDFNDMVFFF